MVEPQRSRLHIQVPYPEQPKSEQGPDEGSSPHSLHSPKKFYFKGDGGSTQPRSPAQNKMKNSSPRQQRNEIEESKDEESRDSPRARNGVKFAAEGQAQMAKSDPPPAPGGVSRDDAMMMSSEVLAPAASKVGWSLSIKTSPPCSPAHTASAADVRANTDFNKRHNGLQNSTTNEENDLSPMWLTPRHNGNKTPFVFGNDVGARQKFNSTPLVQPSQFLDEFLNGGSKSETPVERVERVFCLAVERPQVHRVPGAMKSPRRVRSRLRKLFVENYPNQLHVLEEMISLVRSGFLEEQAVFTFFSDSNQDFLSKQFATNKQELNALDKPNVSFNAYTRTVQLQRLGGTPEIPIHEPTCFEPPLAPVPTTAEVAAAEQQAQSSSRRRRRKKKTRRRTKRLSLEDKAGLYAWRSDLDPSAVPFRCPPSPVKSNRGSAQERQQEQHQQHQQAADTLQSSNVARNNATWTASAPRTLSQDVRNKNMFALDLHTAEKSMNSVSLNSPQRESRGSIEQRSTRVELEGRQSLTNQSVVMQQQPHSYETGPRQHVFRATLTQGNVDAVRHVLEATAKSTGPAAAAALASGESLLGPLPLSIAIRSMKKEAHVMECVALLIQHGANAGNLDAYSKTTLHYAVEKDYGRVTSMLLRTCTIPINHQDIMGNTAMHIAAEYGSLDCIVRLIAYGADCNILNGKGLSAIDVAWTKGFADCASAISGGNL